MTKKISRIVAVVMLIGAIIFLLFALRHPDASFPWNNTVSYTIYATYFIFMVIFFVAPFKKH